MVGMAFLTSVNPSINWVTRVIAFKSDASTTKSPKSMASAVRFREQTPHKARYVRFQSVDAAKPGSSKSAKKERSVRFAEPSRKTRSTSSPVLKMRIVARDPASDMRAAHQTELLRRGYSIVAIRRTDRSRR